MFLFIIHAIHNQALSVITHFPIAHVFSTFALFWIFTVYLIIYCLYIDVKLKCDAVSWYILYQITVFSEDTALSIDGAHLDRKGNIRQSINKQRLHMVTSYHNNEF